MPRAGSFVCGSLLLLIGLAPTVRASEPPDPETAIRQMVRANAEKDLSTLSRLMAHDADIVSYSVGGRKYVGWPEFEQEMREEFINTQKIEIPITELKVWSKGDLAWFTMELDYTRYVGEGSAVKRTVLPLRETGVLERRAGRWQLLSWHESFRSAQLGGPLASPSMAAGSQKLVSGAAAAMPDVSGEWDILEVEDEKRYKATLDKNGNGPYTQHGGRFVTTKIENRLWQGTWHQPGNDREGGFEVLLSEDGTQAKGIWWYTRVDTRKNIPPKEHGGTYHWKKVTPLPASVQ
ncbi:MAG: nuclear transport factor 2 family protein [Nitrospira sp.]|nr:nuclear transport factor 2 family protein [Nitrospira sp. BO4]